MNQISSIAYRARTAALKQREVFGKKKIIISAAVFILAVLSLIFLFGQLVALQNKILEIKKELTVLMTLNSEFEAEAAQILSTQNIEKVASILNLIEVKETSYLIEPSLPVAVER